MLGMHVVNDCLLVPLGLAPDEQAIRSLQAEVLEQTQANYFKGVIFDVSAVHLLDSSAFALLVGVARAISLMGFNSIFVGFQAGVAGSLIDLGVDAGGINTAVNIEDAFEMLQGLGLSWAEKDRIEVLAGLDDHDREDD